MKKFWQSNKFKRLEKKWDEILKGSGFKDIEWNRTKLKQTANHNYWGMTQVQIENKQRYWELIRIRFHEENFEDNVERIVMARTARGSKQKEICQELATLGHRCHRNTVRKIQRRFEIKWGIKKQIT